MVARKNVWDKAEALKKVRKAKKLRVTWPCMFGVGHGWRCGDN